MEEFIDLNSCFLIYQNLPVYEFYFEKIKFNLIFILKIKRDRINFHFDVVVICVGKIIFLNKPCYLKLQ